MRRGGPSRGGAGSPDGQFDGVREPLILRGDVPLPAAAPLAFVRPNDPIIASEVRALAQEIIAECIEAGSAEVVSEVAMPLQAHALVRVLGLTSDHADEWISWGLAALEEDAHGVSPLVLDYVDRQLIGARRSGSRDFFAALDRAVIDGRRLDYDARRMFAGKLLSAGRARPVSMLAGVLEWLAADPVSVERLHSDAAFRLRTVDSFLGSLPEADAADGLSNPTGRGHVRLLLRALLAVVAARVRRLTVIGRELRTDGHPVEWYALHIAFMPRDENG